MESKEEELWNTVTHFIGLIFSLIGLPVLLYYNQNLTEFSFVSILFFECGMVCVYTSATLYHYTTNLKLKHKLRVFDHISIFYLIAGSYAPVCLITLYDGSGLKIFSTVMIIAVLGTIFKVFYTGKLEKLSLILYLAMGWIIALDFESILNLISFNGLMLLVLSGLSYTIGTVFYSLQKMKYSHAIWHLFVMGGSASHYFLVLFYVI